MKPLVSIVMPVYNSEKYLDDAIGSVLQQSYRNIELICVDDGSTDNSLFILENYAQKDERVKILKQKNQYAGVARNYGMSTAKGKYIMFLDSDDIFEKNMILFLTKRAERLNTDIIYFGFYQFSENIKKRTMMGIPFSSKKVYSSSELKDTLFRIAQGMPWNKFYNRKFISNTGIKFQNLQSNNDEYFTKTVMLEANRILFLNKRFVNYRVSNNNSLQGNYKLKSGNFVKSLSAIYNEMLHRNQYDAFGKGFRRFVIDCFTLTFDKCRSINDYNLVFSFEHDFFYQVGNDCWHDIIENHPAGRIYKAILDANYNLALEELINFRKDNFILKTRIEYRIGCKILSILNLKHYE